MTLLRRSSLRYLLAHRWQFGLSILGVALGVAVVVAVDLANASAERAFEISSDTVTGRTTHQVVGGPNGVPESAFVALRVDARIRRVAPVVEGFVSLPTEPVDEGFAAPRPLRLLGIDPFSEAPFRPSLGAGPLQIDLTRFLSSPGAVLLSRATADDLGLALDDALVVRAGPSLRELRVAGILEARDEQEREAAADLLVADVSTAQEILGLQGRLSRIDLILDEDGEESELLDRVRAQLPAGTQLVGAAARNETTRQLTSAFRLNLKALSLLALVCGVFLVYNTMSFSVVQRRPMIGALRAIGVTRAEIFRLVLSEAGAVGLVGTVLGLVGGIAIGRVLVILVTRTINDLYFVVSVRSLALDPVSLAKGALLGVCGALLAALPAALEATGAPPRAVLMRSQLEAQARRRVVPAAATGTAMLIAGGGLLALVGTDLVLSFAGLFLGILGFALLTPAAVVVGMRLSSTPLAVILGPLGRIAARGVTASLSRTAVAIAALMIAVSVVIGVGVMIDSFRTTVTRWLGSVLVADLYVAPPAAGAVPGGFELDEERAARLAAIDGVERISTVRGVDLPSSAGGRTRLIVFDVDERGESAFQFTSGERAQTLDAFRNGDVLVTEPYAFRNEVAVGDHISLPTDRGARDFRVAGIYYNYASEEGLVALDRRAYEEYWDDPLISGFSVFLADGSELEDTSAAIRAALGDIEVIIQSNRALRATSLAVFDRTFLITGVLRLLVTLVAVIGVLSALMSLQLERAREVGVLRALGLTPTEVWQLSASQSGLMGMVSGVLAMPVGLTLAAVMIFVINRRSFGWSLEMEASPMILAQACLLAIAASLAAGLYPAYRMANMRTGNALREE